MAQLCLPGTTSSSPLSDRRRCCDTSRFRENDGYSSQAFVEEFLFCLSFRGCFLSTAHCYSSFLENKRRLMKQRPLRNPLGIEPSSSSSLSCTKFSSLRY